MKERGPIIVDWGAKEAFLVGKSPSVFDYP